VVIVKVLDKYKEVKSIIAVIRNYIFDP
jgi:hypothetical protein